MMHEKVINRENGTQYKIRVNAYLDSFRHDTMEYRIDLYYKHKGKRMWHRVECDNYEYIKLPSMEEKRKFEYNNYLSYVTEEEIYNSKLELWELLKP